MVMVPAAFSAPDDPGTQIMAAARTTAAESAESTNFINDSSGQRPARHGTSNSRPAESTFQKQPANGCGDLLRFTRLEADRVEDHEAVIAKGRVGGNGRRAVLERSHQFEGREARASRQGQRHGRDLLGIVQALETNGAALEAIETGGKALGHGLPADMAGSIALGDKQLERGQKADDLLLADLANAADAVLGHALQLHLVDE